MKKAVLSGLIMVALVGGACGQDTAELAKKLANPMASLISVPIQFNYNGHIGPGNDGYVWGINIQPIIPFTLNEDWNVVSRTILPVLDEHDVPVQGSGESGLGDIVQSLFLSPKEPGAGGLIWGVGPVFLLPTATDKALGTEKWGAGPTAVGLQQHGPWTYGMLMNHVWSFAGDSDRAQVSSTLLQPFLMYLTPTKTTIGFNTESVYDWENEQWSVPLTVTLQQIIRIGRLPMQVGIGSWYWADSPDNGPQDLGGRVQLTFIFPK